MAENIAETETERTERQTAEPFVTADTRRDGGIPIPGTVRVGTADVYALPIGTRFGAAFRTRVQMAAHHDGGRLGQLAVHIKRKQISYYRTIFHNVFSSEQP